MGKGGLNHKVGKRDKITLRMFGKVIEKNNNFMKLLKTVYITITTCNGIMMSFPTPESEIIYKTLGSGGDTSLQVVCLGGRGLRGHPNNIGYCMFSWSPTRSSK